MREIKFRAWDKTNGIMIDNYVNGVDSYGELKVAQFDIHGLNEFPKLILMQYTGLKDKNDQEIYEGDVVEENDQLSVCCLIEQVAAFAFVPLEIYPSKDFHTIFENYGLDTFFRNDEPNKFVEIIGNIYEHHHLLDGEL